jgi:predicted DsbA family dithiol-disulfide isomerase
LDPVLVEIYSDVVCPWCYIGKRRFERAVADFGEPVDVVYRPFQLDPQAPATPPPVLDAYARKFGGLENARRLMERVTAAAAGEGIEFRLDRALRTNTFEAHRLLLNALEQDPRLQADVKERLLRAYFTDGRDVGDHGVLTEVAVAAGLDRDRTAAFLESDEGRHELRELLDGSIDRGITAVPTFVFAGRWAVPGAQDPETMVRVLQTAQERLAS